MLTLGLNLGEVTLSRAKGGGFNFADWRAQQLDGIWIDYTDPDWLRQEVNGPTAVAAANDPIGLALSRRLAGQQGTLAGYLASQPELWDHATAGVTSPSSILGVNDYRIQTSGADTGVFQTSIGGRYVIGRTYLVTFEMYDVVSGSIRVGNPASNSFSTPGVKQIFFKAPEADIIIKRNSACDIKIRNISVKEVSRSAATQTGTSQRPRFDGSAGAIHDAFDDNTLTDYVLGAAPGVLIGKVRCPASLSGFQAFIGTNASGNQRGLLGLNTDGRVGFGLGTTSAASITGGPDVRDQVCTIIGAWDGTTGRAFVNGVQVAEVVQAGAPTATTPIRIGAWNNDTTAFGFWAGRIFSAGAFRTAALVDQALAQRIHNAII